jgi:Skp family chaperone for outer membrane proteins
MRHVLFAAAVAAAALTAPTAAIAQRVPGAAVAVVDTARVYAECTACRSAQTQLQTQVNTLRTRQQTLTNQLRTEGQPLQQQIQALNGREPDAALRTRIQAFEQKQTQANQELSQGQQRVQSIQANVLRQINERMGPIINTVMTQRGANIAVSADAALAHAPALDITGDVLAQLNRALPSVSLTPLPQAQQSQGR